MSAAARGAAGFLYASGRLRMLQMRERDKRRQQEAERAAEALKLEREAKDRRSKP